MLRMSAYAGMAALLYLHGPQIIAQEATEWSDCADENRTCNFQGTKLVRYGKGDTWVKALHTDGVPCNNGIFGDPLFGTYKECQIAERPAESDKLATAPSELLLQNLTCNSGTLSWQAPAESGDVSSYDIYRDGQLLDSVGGAELSADLTLEPGASWGIYVNALDAAGNLSPPSDTLPVEIPDCEEDNVAPSVPDNLSASAEGTSVSLSWDAATDNIAVTSYDVLRDGVAVGSTTDLAFDDSGLAENREYRYTVVAGDAQENVSAPSSPASVTTGTSCSSAVCSVDQAATDNDIPWGLVTLSDGSILYSRRDAQDIVLLKDGVQTTIGTVPGVEGTGGEGGLLGLAITEDFPESDPWLYVFHTSRDDNRLVRMRFENDELNTASREVLLDGIGKNRFHNGGRLRFGPDGKLYVATGDAQSESSAQDIERYAGKILRINPDGSTPSDNPFDNLVWSYGHRNPQGLAFDSEGRLWQQEFGDRRQDETNLIRKGGNYGWPECEGTRSRSGDGCSQEGFIAPKATYATSEGSCSGIAIVDDVLYVACLRGERLYRGEISGDSLPGSMQELFVGSYGRLRTVEPTVDGNLWMTTSNDGDRDSTPNNSNNEIFVVDLGD